MSISLTCSVFSHQYVLVMSHDYFDTQMSDGLIPASPQVWKCFQQYSTKYHEQFAAAAQVIAEIISLVEPLGTSEPQIWGKFRGTSLGIT